VTDLTSRITAALDEQQRLAEAAEAVVPSPWWYSERRSVLLDAKARDIAKIGYVDGRHAAANDPSSVLRRVAAQRRTLERHAELPNSWGSCSACLSPGGMVGGPAWRSSTSLTLLAWVST
jgi:hypothetical protein